MANKQKHTGIQLDHPVVIDALAGGLAGGITAVFVSPLEVLKTRLQTQELKGPDRYQGGFHIYGGLQRIVRSEGVGGLYRGLGPQFMALFPNWAVYFTVYNRLKGTLGKRQSLPQPMVHMLSAVGAGAATSVVTNPLWVAKTRLQTQHMANRPAGREIYRGTMHCMYSIARREGVGALWSGMGASMVGLVHVAVQFPCYEKLKQLLSERRERISHTRELQPVDLILASALSKEDQPTYSVTDIVLAASAATGHQQALDAGLGTWDADSWWAPDKGAKQIADAVAVLVKYREEGLKPSCSSSKPA